jgi:hypothetical protein
MISSDIGHWDVPDMTKVLEQAYGLVDKELMSEEDFRDFVFTNPISLHAGMNPDFFKGTVVEQAAKEILDVSPAITNSDQLTENETSAVAQ